MCTRLIEPTKTKYGYKMVRVFDGDINSALNRFKWKKGLNKARYHGGFDKKVKKHDIVEYGYFHFCSTLKQVLEFSCMLNYNSTEKEIIRCELRGKRFKGTHTHLGELDGKVAYIATKAYWDGTFVKV